MIFLSDKKIISLEMGQFIGSRQGHFRIINSCPVTFKIEQVNRSQIIASESLIVGDLETLLENTFINSSRNQIHRANENISVSPRSLLR